MSVCLFLWSLCTATFLANLNQIWHVALTSLHRKDGYGRYKLNMDTIWQILLRSQGSCAYGDVDVFVCVIFILLQKIQKMAKCTFWYQLTHVVPESRKMCVFEVVG